MTAAGSPDDPVRPGPVISVRDAFCLHPLPDGGAVAALRGLSLTADAGERLVLHGPNGSGKTTLLKVLSGDQRLAAGRAEVAGLDLSTAVGDLPAWRARMLGQVDQNPWGLLRPEFDVVGNVALQLRVAGSTTAAARETAEQTLAALGVAHLAGRPPGTLSGGERQRVAICAALAHRPQLLLADEPTGELDARTADEVHAFLSEAVQAVGATLVLVSHDRRAASIADRVLRIRDGRISESRRAGRDEARLVVDERGWMWLPPQAREQLGDELRLEQTDDGTVLRGDGPATPAQVTLTPSVLPVREVRKRAGERGAGERGAGGVGPLARLSDVRVELDGRTLFEGLHLSVEPGQLVALTGRSGSGKSTLLRVLLGLNRPAAGRVELAGQDVGTLDRDRLAALRRRSCAVVVQQVQLARNVDAAANLDLARAGRGLPAEPAEEWLRLVGMDGFTGRPVGDLSGGERQRVALARALATRPPLLVLDEPTSQLDEGGAELLAGLLSQVARSGTGILVATHDPTLVAAADVETRLDLLRQPPR